MDSGRKHPVLVVHGMWDSARRVMPLTDGLRRRGFDVHAFDQPSRGDVPIAELAALTADHVAQVRARCNVERVDIVGFSMGALNSRYYLQRLGGSAHVRRFISISGPHQGTWMAYALSLPGIVDMRPNSKLIADLNRDSDPWGDVETHVIYTPFDLTIVPAHSSELRNAKTTHRLPIKVHRWMVEDPRVHDLVATLLSD